MKGIALETIAYLTIAVVTILLIFSLITGNLSPSLKNAYCSFVSSLRSVLPLPSYMRPTVPAYCEEGKKHLKTEIIEATNPAMIESTIASYMLACWEETGGINLGQDTICYEIVIKNKPSAPVSMRNINDTLTNEGFPDLMIWKTDKTISVEKSIIISYDSTSKKIEVS